MKNNRNEVLLYYNKNESDQIVLFCYHLLIAYRSQNKHQRYGE